MGWRSTLKDVEDGSLSFAPKPEVESTMQGVGRALSTYFEINADEMAAKAQKVIDDEEALKTKEAEAATALDMTNVALNAVLGSTTNEKAKKQVLAYALNNPDQDDINTFAQSLNITPVVGATKVETPVSNTAPIIDTTKEITTPVVEEVKVEPNVVSINNALTFTESSNNPNALWNQSQTGQFSNEKPITEKTFSEVLDFVKRDGAYAAWSRTQSAEKTTHTPVGKYQFVGRTLRDIVSRAKDTGTWDELGIDDDTLFTEEVQDRLFNWYAKDTIRQAGTNASQEEIREKFRGRWQALTQNKDGSSRRDNPNGVPKVTDAELDVIIEEVQSGNYLSAQTEAMLSEGEASEVEEIVTQTNEALAEGKVVELPTSGPIDENQAYTFKTDASTDSLKGLNVDELRLKLKDPQTSEEDKTRIQAMIGDIPEVDKLASNPSLVNLRTMLGDPINKDDTLLLERIRARIAIIEETNANTSKEAMQTELNALDDAGLKRRRDELNAKKEELGELSSNEIMILEQINQKLSGVDASEAADLELQNSDATFLKGANTKEAIIDLRGQLQVALNTATTMQEGEEKKKALSDITRRSELLDFQMAMIDPAESNRDFMTGVSTASEISAKTAELDAMTIASNREPDADKQDALKRIIADRKILLAAATNRLLVEEERKAAAALAADKAKGINAANAKSQATMFVRYTYGENGTLQEVGTVYNDGTNFINQQGQVVSPEDMSASVIYLPEAVDTTIKTYNKDVTAASDKATAAVDMTNALLTLRQLVVDNPEQANSYTRSIGVLSENATALYDTFNQVIGEGSGYAALEGTALAKLTELSNIDKTLASQFLRVAYQMAKVRGSTGQGLSNKELDGILASLGATIKDPNKFIGHINSTIKAELESADIQRQGSLNSIVGMRSGVEDIFMNTPIGRPIDQTITEMLSPEALINYNDAKSGGLGIKSNTEQRPKKPTDQAEIDALPHPMSREEVEALSNTWFVGADNKVRWKGSN